MSFMENHVLAYKAPLYGRRTAQFKLQPFTFLEARKCFKRFSNLDLAIIYGVIGGTPQYLMQVQDSLSVEENIKTLFLNPNSPLYEEPTNLLKQEVREPALYNAIISAIASGSSRLAEISGKVGEESSVCSAYLKNLISLGLVRRENPFGYQFSKNHLFCRRQYVPILVSVYPGESVQHQPWRSGSCLEADRAISSRFYGACV